MRFVHPSSTRRSSALPHMAACVALFAAPAVASAQHVHSDPAGSATTATQTTPPMSAGQSAYQALAEIVRILEADPHTDWSRVDLERVRRHLIDMHEVTLNAEVSQVPVNGGFEATVTGTGRTVEAIRRMARAHASQIAGETPYRAQVTEIDRGVRIRVVVTLQRESPGELAKLRGLGFVGLLTLGDHHGPHHLAMARGGAGGHP